MLCLLKTFEIQSSHSVLLVIVFSWTAVQIISKALPIVQETGTLESTIMKFQGLSQDSQPSILMIENTGLYALAESYDNHNS